MFKNIYEGTNYHFDAFTVKISRRQRSRPPYPILLGIQAGLSWVRATISNPPRTIAINDFWTIHNPLEGVIDPVAKFLDDTEPFRVTMGNGDNWYWRIRSGVVETTEGFDTPNDKGWTQLNKTQLKLTYTNIWLRESMRLDAGQANGLCWEGLIKPLEDGSGYCLCGGKTISDVLNFASSGRD